MGTPLFKILIVDDEPLVQILITQILEPRGMYEVETASSGEEALLTLSAFNPDIILLDVEMAGMDGYTVCRQIRADAKYRFTKIIMVSGCDRTEERLHGYEAGADDYITKPFEEQEFLAKVKVYTRLKHREEVDQVKGDLLRLLTHETMTPINGILGCSEILLADSSLEAGHRELVTMIVSAGRQLNRFLQNAILLSKLKAGLALTMSFEPVVALVKHIVAECAMRYEEKDIQVSVRGSEKLQFEADWPLLSYAIMAIISNAMKFSPVAGHVTVDVGTENNFCCIVVDDQGCGVDQERKGRIFEEFSISDVTHHKRGQGLSMAISYRICSRHGGDIAVRDNPAGAGSRFRMTIPMGVSE
ncbi:MAG: hybrid sensor histidine kinase/response regulator [Proteobacteria bacterium]|nr:hybrid sensor histidine kinase/response regulator [Pseudomonadota bacterium]MBU1641047.1 hybrid sensor histidine kinase/response regulator [Pseudomonadota bacterium]